MAQTPMRKPHPNRSEVRGVTAGQTGGTAAGDSDRTAWPMEPTPTLGVRALLFRAQVPAAGFPLLSGEMLRRCGP